MKARGSSGLEDFAACLRTIGPGDKSPEQTSAAHICLNSVARVERETNLGADARQGYLGPQKFFGVLPDLGAGGTPAVPGENKSPEAGRKNSIPNSSPEAGWKPALPQGSTEAGRKNSIPNSSPEAGWKPALPQGSPEAGWKPALPFQGNIHNPEIPKNFVLPKLADPNAVNPGLASELSAARRVQSHGDILTQAQRLEQARVEQKLTNDMLDKIERAHFNYFVDHSDPVTGLTKDRSAGYSPASIAATGFSLSAHIAASERAYITRDQAADYTLKVLRTLWNAPQSDATSGAAGYKGFFYHFLDLKTAERAWKSELSTIDTALLMAGVLTSQTYFDRNNPKEKEIRDLSTKLYDRVDWNWAMQRDRMSLGWHPERGFLPYEWGAYTEAMIMMTLGLGSKTHPIPASAWKKYTDSTHVDKLADGRKYASFGPMFGHQYSQAWIDYRGIKDDVNRKIGADYFENSRRATIAQNEYAKKNPLNWRGYSSVDWGLTASDGPGGGGVIEKDYNGQKVKFFSYRARGAPHDFDDGTIAPTAAASSLPFAPELVLPTLKHWMKNRPELMTPHGFADAFNPSFDTTKNSGWIDSDTIGIDQGPIVMMTENYRSGLFWNLMRKNPTIKRGLQRGGFSGGWLK